MKVQTLVGLSTMLVWLAATTAVAQNQLVINGNFESGAAGTAPGAPYLVQTEAGSSVVLNGAIHSPFVNAYPAGNQSVRLTDGGSALVWPQLRQQFAEQGPPTQLEINFDFLLEGPLISSDLWSFQIDDANRNRAPFIALINGNENSVPNSFSIVGSSTSVPLQAGQWYNLSATMNLSLQLIVATLTPFGGSATSFSAPTLEGSFYATHADMRDLSLGQNQPIYFDNVSVVVTPVPEPAVGALALLSIAGWALRRYCRRSQ